MLIPSFSTVFSVSLSPSLGLSLVQCNFIVFGGTVTPSCLLSPPVFLLTLSATNPRKAFFFTYPYKHLLPYADTWSKCWSVSIQLKLQLQRLKLLVWINIFSSLYFSFCFSDIIFYFGILQTRTVQVKHVSDLAGEREIHEFFSFSGEIEHIEIQRWVICVHE